MDIFWQIFSYSAIFAQFMPAEYIRIFKWIYLDIHSTNILPYKYIRIFICIGKIYSLHTGSNVVKQIVIALFPHKLRLHLEFHLPMFPRSLCKFNLPWTTPSMKNRLWAYTYMHIPSICIRLCVGVSPIFWTTWGSIYENPYDPFFWSKMSECFGRMVCEQG